MKIKCVRHNRRVFINGESGTVRHRSDLSNCDTASVTGIRALPSGVVMGRAQIIWLCDPFMPSHYRDTRRVRLVGDAIGEPYITGDRGHKYPIEEEL